MNWNKHYQQEGKHALLGASKYYWLNYDEEKIENFYKSSLAVQKGTELHEFAAKCIKLGQKLPKSKKTLNSYVNDAIGYMMTPEQVLYYSDNCFGTADAISFRDNLLRIHDLKTGISPTHMEQLMIYAALFCLEYEVNPNTINIELRIYQNDEVNIFEPDSNDIIEITKKIISFNRVINKLKYSEES